MSSDATQDLGRKPWKPAWSTKEWKEKREAILKDACEQCGSTKPPLVVQHFWHPSDLEPPKREARDRLYEGMVAAGEWAPAPSELLGRVRVNKDPGSVAGLRCPACGAARLAIRQKTRPKYRCNTCKATTDDPTVTMRDAYRTDRQRFYEAQRESIWALARQIAQERKRAYESLDGTQHFTTQHSRVRRSPV